MHVFFGFLFRHLILYLLQLLPFLLPAVLELCGRILVIHPAFCSFLKCIDLRWLLERLLLSGIGKQSFFQESSISYHCSLCSMFISPSSIDKCRPLSHEFQWTQFPRISRGCVSWGRGGGRKSNVLK